jgi:GNAT superfamily N-acetyltransferase
MKLVRWTRFTWDLAKLPARENSLAKCYTLRAASRDEETAVAAVVLRAFSLDSDWADQWGLLRERLDWQLRLAFERESVPAVVILHGSRIVAASVLSTEVEAESSLISGPCVLAEYRNRGLGSALLHASLAHLAQAGLPQAHAISKENAPSMRFVYPKFCSTRAPCEYEPALAVC